MGVENGELRLTWTVEMGQPQGSERVEFEVVGRAVMSYSDVIKKKSIKLLF